MEETKTALALAAEIARYLGVASLGLFAGGMLTEGALLVPYWRSLAPADFLAWYAAHGHRLQGFFGPLTTATGVLALLAAILSVWAGHPGRWLMAFAAVLMLVAVATFFIYFGKANASFADGSVGVQNVPSELARWGRWHWMRTGLSFIALAAALLSIWRR
jgi:prepilin-type processing-associated H-X9-DG protein